MSRNAWLIAFADLSAVLTAFFVLLLAMSDFNAPALRSIATVFGSDEGDWAVQRPAPPVSVQAVPRSAGDERDADYLAAIVTGRLDRADWPWSLERRHGEVALRQVLQPGGPDLPADMAAWLRTIGYPLSVVAVMSDRGERLAGTRGVFDDGLRAAGGLAGRLMIHGVAENVPIRTRFATDPAPLTMEIVLRVSEENQ